MEMHNVPKAAADLPVEARLDAVEPGEDRDLKKKRGGLSAKLRDLISGGSKE